MFDAYADMYAYSEGESPADELELASPPLRSPSPSPQPSPAPTRPWDQRGKTGLYGGGGRGADDSETGWVRNFQPEGDEDQRGKRDSRFRADEEEGSHGGGRGRSGEEEEERYGNGGRGSSSTDG